MSKVPSVIASAFYRLKEEYNHIYLKKINGNYYVYRQLYEWQKKNKKSRTIAEYLGRLTTEGKFIKRIASYKNDLEKATALIAAHGGKISWEEQRTTKIYNAQQQSDIDVSGNYAEILTALSMNSRMQISHISKLLGINKSTIYHNMVALEKKFGMKYELELDTEKLGYITYLLMVKFEHNVPNSTELKTAIDKNPRIQFAVVTKGDYDLIIYIIDEGPIKAEDNLWKFRSETILGSYSAQWYLMPLGQVYSFVPIRDVFIEKVLKRRVRSSTNRRSLNAREGFTKRELAVLKELNHNSNEDFTVIDTKYDFGHGASRYTYEELIKEGIIIRPTITLSLLQIKYIGVLLLETSTALEVDRTRYKLLEDIIDKTKHPVNKYSLVGNIGAPGGMIFFMPVMEDDELDKSLQYYKNEVSGVIMKSMIVTEVLVGCLCYRRFDNDYSRQHSLLVGLKKAEAKKLADYDRKSPKQDNDEEIYF